MIARPFERCYDPRRGERLLIDIFTRFTAPLGVLDREPRQLAWSALYRCPHLRTHNGALIRLAQETKHFQIS